MAAPYESMNNDDIEFRSSELGKKTFWDESYKREIENFQDTGDNGEVWFGTDSVERVTNWVSCNIKEHNSSIIDIGCGNGYSLFDLYNAGFKNLIGIDYSEDAIILAKKIADSKYITDVNFKVINFCEPLKDFKKYDVLIDKGTFDAISLSTENVEDKKNKYKSNIINLMHKGSVFIITSCNWTRDELLLYFNDVLRLKDSINTPTFQFGGVTGNRETCLIFELI